jgi:Domain of unknown function (DUF4149)
MSICRFLRVFALGTWVGAIIFFVVGVAPVAFAVLGNRDDAGALVRVSLGRLHTLGLICAVVFVVASLVAGGSLGALARPAVLGVILMAALTFTSQNVVMKRMRILQGQMGSVDATPADNALRAEFDKLHNISVRLEGAVLLIGIASIFLMVRGDLAGK